MNCRSTKFSEFIKDHDAYVILEDTMALVRCHADECETCKHTKYLNSYPVIYPIMYLYNENLDAAKVTHPEYFI